MLRSTALFYITTIYVELHITDTPIVNAVRKICCQPFDAVIRSKLCSLCQQSLRPNWHFMGRPIKLITPHDSYLSLGSTDVQRQLTYKALFEQKIPDYTITEIRNALNKAWVLGEDRFKQQIEEQLGMSISKAKHGGDRKSFSYRSKK